MAVNQQDRVGFKYTNVGWIPEDWEIDSFGEIAERRDERFDPKSNSDVYKCIELEHIEKGSGRLLGYVDACYQASLKNVFYPNDILFGKLRPYLRKYALIDFQGVCSSEIWVIKSNGKCIPAYIYAIVQSEKFITYSNKTSGTKMPRSDWDLVSSINYPIPPIHEQAKIAEILSTWDRAIENLEKLIDAKQRLKKGLMQQLLTGKKRFSDCGDPIIKGNDLPFGWKIKRLGSISEVLVSSVDKKIKNNENLVYLCNYMDVYSNDYIHKEIDFMRATAQKVEIEKYHVKKGDVLLTKDSETSDEIASMAVVVEDIQNLLCGYHLAIIRPVRKEADSIFLSKTLSINESHRYFQAHANGVTRFGLTISSIKNVFVRLPILEEQEKIRDVLLNVDEEISQLEKNKNKLREQKQGLMQKLLTGKVRMKI